MLKIDNIALADVLLNTISKIVYDEAVLWKILWGRGIINAAFSEEIKLGMCLFVVCFVPLYFDDKQGGGQRHEYCRGWDSVC